VRVGEPAEIRRHFPLLARPNHEDRRLWSSDWLSAVSESRKPKPLSNAQFNINKLFFR
jgi:hypothetical protein